MLNVKNNKFNIDVQTRQTIFFVEEKETVSFSVGIAYQDGDFDQEEVSPSININTIVTQAKTIEDLKGFEFEVADVEESDERQDRFYLFNHEPFVELKLKIVDINADFATISCRGIAVLDGYENPMLTAPFELKEKLPIIKDNADWEKFNR